MYWLPAPRNQPHAYRPQAGPHRHAHIVHPALHCTHLFELERLLDEVQQLTHVELLLGRTLQEHRHVVARTQTTLLGQVQRHLPRRWKNCGKRVRVPPQPSSQPRVAAVTALQASVLGWVESGVELGKLSLAEPDGELVHQRRP